MKFKIEKWIENKILRNISEEVKNLEISKYAKLWEEMVKYIKNPDNWWVWLAAPQIWVNKRVIALALMKTTKDENFKFMYMINPEVIELGWKIITGEEWCLSVPGLVWEVERYEKVKVSYLDKNGKKNIIILEWFMSRIFQHEFDHLEWILFTDKAENIEKIENL